MVEIDRSIGGYCTPSVAPRKAVVSVASKKTQTLIIFPPRLQNAPLPGKREGVLTEAVR